MPSCTPCSRTLTRTSDTILITHVTQRSNERYIPTMIYVYDIRQSLGGNWQVVRINLDTGRAEFVCQFPTKTEARKDADKRNLRPRGYR